MSVTDLTNTTWIFNDTIDLETAETWYIDFISANISYLTVQVRSIFREKMLIYVSNGEQRAVYSKSGWINDDVKRIEITGGVNTTNTKLISWLESNATQVVPLETNRLYIKCSNNGRPRVKISTTNTQRLYAKIKTKDLINFTIAGVSYQAEEGMTWEDWVNSSYNIDGFYILDLVRFADDSPVCEHPSGSASVNSSEIIISDGIYYKGSNSGGAL